jgi:thiol:disulfide interchange protein DsbD
MSVAGEARRESRICCPLERSSGHIGVSREPALSSDSGAGYSCFAMHRQLLALAVLCLTLLQGLGAHAQPAAPAGATRNVDVQLVPEHPSVPPGGTVTIAFHQDIRQGWHTYWTNFGDAGAAPTVEWQLPEGWRAGEIQWPYPRRVPFGPFMNFGYEDEVTLLIDVTAPETARPGETVTLPARVTVYVCSDICVPEDSEHEVTLQIAAVTAPATTSNALLFAQARALLPRPTPWPALFAVAGDRFALLVQSPELAAARPEMVDFFPYTDGYIVHAAATTSRTTEEGLLLETQAGRNFTEQGAPQIENVVGVLVVTGTDGRTDAFSVNAQPGAVPVSAIPRLSIPAALLFAFLGGMILNLMPCVLPVLSMKALALAAAARVPAAAKAEALAYGAGVLASFAALAAALLGLRAAGVAVGWGFQLQQPLFVALLALLMFAVGLNLSGLFEVSAGRFAGLGQVSAERGGVVGSFFTGVLSTIVATPCTAPFMAAAIGFGVTQPAPVAFAIFIALAVGFAAPFVALGLIPAALRIVPRPGPWMNRMKQLLALPMYGAALWLAWVLGQQTGSNGFVALAGAALLLAFALWSYDAGRHAPKPARRHAGLAAAAISLGCAVAVLLYGTGRQAVPSAELTAEVLPYEPYSAARLAALRAERKPVFVNATAAWCITCLVNERVALSGDAVERAFAEAGVVALKADWTNRNAEIAALLSQHGRSGVPLYLYYPAGSQARILPQILTEATVLSVVQSGS